MFETAHLSQHFDKVFARRCREQYIARQLTSYDLTNATSVAAQEIEPFEPSRSFLRHIDPEILTINFELYTYDDVVTLLDYGKHDTTSHQPIAHATEIHHPALAAMMRQIFDAMWNLGEPLEVSTR